MLSPYIKLSTTKNGSAIQDLVDIAWKNEENHKEVIEILEENEIDFER
jgi:hypothetical protein